MVCTLRLIWVQQRVDAYKRIATGEGPTFLERWRARLICEECEETMAESFLWHCM